MYHMANIKKFFDYTKRKDGFMGRENRRYWLMDTKTKKKRRITESQLYNWEEGKHEFYIT